MTLETAVAERLEQEALARWHRGGAAGPEPAIRIETKGRGYEVTASSPDRSATLWLSTRFVNDLVSGTGAACARCADRFFEKLFERLVTPGSGKREEARNAAPRPL